MAMPDWFDATLKLPRPRRVVASWRLWAVRTLLVTIPAYFVLVGTVFATRSTIPGLWLIVLLLAVAFGVVVESMASKPRGFLRDGIAALARVVAGTGGATVVDVLRGGVELAAALGGQRPTDSSRDVAYEYPTGPETTEEGSTRVRTTAMGSEYTDARFPEGVELGARFVVLFDPKRPQSHLIFRKAGLFRIVSPD